jgi:hypothetical protein
MKKTGVALAENWTESLTICHISFRISTSLLFHALLSSLRVVEWDIEADI